jgi:hypothetical protein
MEQEITPEVRMQIVAQERQMWLNTREMFTYRHRVFKRLEDKAQMEAVEKELEKCEKALDEIDKIFTEMQEAAK